MPSIPVDTSLRCACGPNTAFRVTDEIGWCQECGLLFKFKRNDDGSVGASFFHHKGPRSTAVPADLRAAGWVVAVHNDFRLNGEPHTFWLFTKEGRAVKGEGRTDAEALDQVRAAIATNRARYERLERGVESLQALLAEHRGSGGNGVRQHEPPPCGHDDLQTDCLECAREDARRCAFWERQALYERDALRFALGAVVAAAEGVRPKSDLDAIIADVADMLANGADAETWKHRLAWTHLTDSDEVPKT